MFDPPQHDAEAVADIIHTLICGRPPVSMQSVSEPEKMERVLHINVQNSKYLRLINEYYMIADPEANQAIWKQNTNNQAPPQLPFYAKKRDHSKSDLSSDNLEMHELLFPFRNQVELFTCQKHFMMPSSPFGGIVVSRINQLFEIKQVIRSITPGHFWIQQRNILRQLDAKTLAFKRQIKLEQEEGDLNIFESEGHAGLSGPLWIL